MASISAIEESLHNNQKSSAKSGINFENMAQTILYAKFTIFLQDKDWIAAESQLKDILENGPYVQCVRAIELYLMENVQDTRMVGVEFYRILATKFST